LIFNELIGDIAIFCVPNFYRLMCKILRGGSETVFKWKIEKKDHLVAAFTRPDLAYLILD
jgi:hypothetical protein